jgi:5'-methylthioadenosine phosphorylase
VGALAEDVKVGDLVLPDQYIDLTGLPSTFHDGGEGGLLHMDMSEPFCPSLRGLFVTAGKETGIPVREGGVYTCIAGPQFETRAEAAMLRTMGGTVAGMTVVPEAKLAREAGICYQPAAMAVNLTGETSPRLTHDNTVEVMGKNLPRLALLLRSAAARLHGRPGCVCPRVPIPYKG